MNKFIAKIALVIACVCGCCGVAKATGGYGNAAVQRQVVQYYYAPPQAFVQVPVYQVERIQGDGYIQKQEKVVRQRQNVVIVDNPYDYDFQQSQALRVQRNALVLQSQRRRLVRNSQQLRSGGRSVQRSREFSRSR